MSPPSALIEDEDILLDLASLALSWITTDIAPYLERLEEIEYWVCREGRSAFLPRERAPCFCACCMVSWGLSAVPTL